MKIAPAERLNGNVFVPGDKSVSHRAAILGSMAVGETRITNFSTAADCHTTLRCLGQLGVSVRQDGKDVVVKGVGKRGFRRPEQPLDCGNSGTTARLLMGLLAGQPFESVITGDDSLRSRPMRRVIEPLRQMGASIDDTDGRLPVTVRGGTLYGIDHEMPVASAQVKSCLLLAGLLADGETTVIEPAQTRDHTERMLRWLGAELESSQGLVRLSGDVQIQGRDVLVPGDISSAAFFMAAAACVEGAAIHLPDVGLNPTRTGIVDVLRRLGFAIDVAEAMDGEPEPKGTITVRGRRKPAGSGEGCCLSGTDIPGIIDELPVLAVLGTQIEAGLEIRDAGELRYKETDRLAATAENLRRMGAAVEERPDGLLIGRCELKGAVVDSFGDHRIAMAFAVAGVLAAGETEIRGAECVDISFPGFFAALSAVTA